MKGPRRSPPPTGHMCRKKIAILIIMYSLYPKDTNKILQHGVFEGYSQFQPILVLTALLELQQDFLNTYNDDQKEELYNLTPPVKTVIYLCSKMITCQEHKKRVPSKMDDLNESKTKNIEDHCGAKRISYHEEMLLLLEKTWKQPMQAGNNEVA